MLRAEGLTPDAVIGGGFCCAITGHDAAEMELRSWRGVTSAIADAETSTVTIELADGAPAVGQLVDALADLGLGPVHVETVQSA